MILNTAILITIAIALGLLWLPGLRKAQTWRAMVTPLASIIGSGFLVLGPLLNHAYGLWGPLVMGALCLVAWGFGTAIRDNIRAIDRDGQAGPAWVENTASALLGFAYMVSVAYYLNLLGSFAVSLLPFQSQVLARSITTAVYAVIVFVGWTRGFALLERMEYASVALKLAIIAGLVLALGVYLGQAVSQDALIVTQPFETGWPALTLAFGMIVTVQGFETSRYLGGEYDAPTRIRSMRNAQLLATAIYLVYIALVTYTFSPATQALSETAIVDMMGVISPVLPVVLVAAALAAQFSAAVADTGGSGGLLQELSHRRISQKQAYALTVAVGLALTWAADVFEIIAYASRAFAAYYAVQSALAAWRCRRDAPARAGLYALLALLGLAIVFFGRAIE
ncbi:hypothetical protein JI664_11870 [Rhodobacter sp. NTK016B]|uniref:hypothetical protein n=1 Tax=Rhodobacter sp. NTK016B TaxID=2759676 RepID=UPI001A8F2A6C|nr:hypothetical protein [Rhodobacter sp. NTK016B]MBN8292662.1 hypothetical protein [Rhodobacter sp. NTK016B]